MDERTNAKRDREMEFGLWRAIFISMTHLLNTVEGDVKAAHDLTLIDFGILILTSHQEGAVPMGTLAAIFGVDPSVVTYRVKRLEIRGLVLRTTGSGDRRFTFVQSTPVGLALLPAARQAMLDSAQRHLLSKLEPTEVPVLASAFNRLLETQRADLAPRTDTPQPQGVDR
jgi:DNA-binding MarR family transcriptional regulator